VIKKYYPYFVCGGFSIVFAVFAYFVVQSKTTAFDSLVYGVLTSYMHPVITWIFIGITNLGGFVALIALAIALPLLVFKKKELIVVLLSELAVVSLINLLVKEVFSRARPQGLMLVQEMGYSFPSGHAMASMAFYGLVIYLVWRMSYKRSTKIVVTLGLGMLVLLICASRVYLGVHYASDVLAGLSISLALLMVLIVFYPKLEWRFSLFLHS
jgi:undecaprenyl-diphosphatase